MSHMIDVRSVPVPALVKGFLDAMRKNQAEAWLIFKQGTSGGVASNKDTAESMARSHLAIKDGALEVAAIALHVWRMAPAASGAETAPSADDTTGLCSIVLCAGHELAVGKAVAWDDLPDEIREAHRAVAKVVVGAAVGHCPPLQDKSRIITPA